MLIRRSLWICVAIALCWASPAVAQDAALDKARTQFDRGQQLFQAGQYAEAAEQFVGAYQSRPFAAFLYNAALSYEKGRDWKNAIEYYNKYLKENPQAKDAGKVKKRIKVFESELAKAPPEGTAPGTQPTEVSAEVAALGEAKIRGIVVIESKPQGAYIYLDSKKNDPIGRTPWNGTLEGEHVIFIESEGYKPVEQSISASEDKVTVVVFPLAEEDYLGWVDIRANVPDAKIFIDDRVSGFRAAPFAGNLPPGKHKVWVTKEGYEEFYTEVEVVPGKTHEVVAQLKGSEVGYLNFRGRDVSEIQVFVDGKKVCDGPCRHPVSEGEHRLRIEREGYKPYRKQLLVRSKTETTVKPRLQPKPSRADAIWAYAFAVAFTGAGVYLGNEANKLEDELSDDITAGSPPPDSSDPRFDRGRIFAISADAAYGLGAATFLVAIYYTFRDKGLPSTATTDTSSIAILPTFNPEYAGAAMEVRW